MASDPRTWPLGAATSAIAGLGPEALAATVRAGIAHVELDLFGPSGLDASKPEGVDALGRLAAQIKGAGLTLWSVHLPFGGRWDISTAGGAWAVQQHAQLLARAAEWGAQVAVVHASAEPIGDGERAGRLAAAQGALARLADVGAEQGVRLAVECLPRTCLGNCAEETQTLLSADPRLGVCCDVNHLFRETPAAFIRALGPRIVTLHVSDHDGVDERHWMPGQGVMDWPATVAALAGVGYIGPFLFEVRACAPEEIAEAWRRLLAA